jgi:dolichyl-phosphate-mannose--protein O-mannosyl transferase
MFHIVKKKKENRVRVFDNEGMYRNYYFGTHPKGVKCDISLHFELEGYHIVLESRDSTEMFPLNGGSYRYINSSKK